MIVKKNKKFLVLGIGNAQVDLLHHLHQYYDMDIHALSNSKSGRGGSFVKKFEEIDITDKDAVLAYAKQNKIDYIYSTGSDVAMPTVSWVAEQLGLRTFIDSETAFICNNKHLFREKLKNSYGSVPFEVLNGNLKVKNIKFPAVVKPVDSQGQRGITVVDSIHDLEAAYKKAVSHSRKREALIEEKIDGPEVSVHTYLKDGKIIFFLPSDRISWDGFDGGIIHKHILPASISDKTRKNLLKLVSTILESLTIQNGPVYFQIRIKNDDPFLVEVTPRLDGCHMWRQIHKSTGINLLDITIKHLLGLPFEISTNFDVKRSTLEFFCQPPCKPFRKQKISENSCYHELFYREGDIVRPMNEQMEKCGFQILLDE